MAKPSVSTTFAVTPRFDVFYALYDLMGGVPTPLQEWNERTLARLPAGFQKRALRIAPAPIFWPLLADALQQIPGELSFEDMCRALSDIPLADLRENVLSGIFHGRAVVRSLASGKKSIRQLVTDNSSGGTDLLTHFGLRPYDARSASVRTISALVEHPESFRDELTDLLRQFWQSGFGDDWAGLEPELQAECARLSELYKNFSLGKLAAEIGLPVGFDDTLEVVTSRAGASIPYDRIDHCFFIPSAFNTRRWWAKYESKEGRVSLYFPVMIGVSAVGRLTRSGSRRPTNSLRPHKAVRAEWVFRALGDTTRYAIASILARTPTSSADLARSLRVSKPTITHHVQALRAAGLITDTPSGGSVKLSLNRETVGAVSGAALEQLFSSTAELPLTTTRKRRTPPNDRKNKS